jgi:hypothetical protein
MLWLSFVGRTFSRGAYVTLAFAIVVIVRDPQASLEGLSIPLSPRKFLSPDMFFLISLSPFLPRQMTSSTPVSQSFDATERASDSDPSRALAEMQWEAHLLVSRLE